MATVTNTLYPPQVPTYQDAFLVTDTCRVYFSLSSYDTYDEIKNYAQVTVASQATNKSVLSVSKHPNEIMLKDVYIDSTKSATADRYYIEIEPEDLENGWENNQYYKCQIRFTSSEAPDPPSTSAIDSWLVNYADYFSEWSTITLLRAISVPTLTIQGLSENDTSIITINTLNVIGTLSFEDEEESDSLSSYQIKLYDDSGAVVAESGIQYTSAYNNTNEINYTLNYSLTNGSVYNLTIEIETRNYYSATYAYEIIVSQSQTNPLNALVTAENQSENGRIKIIVANTSTDNEYTGYVIIRRTSNRSNYTIWEDIYTRTYSEPEEINFTWYDCTIESGVWYKYAVQKMTANGQRGTETYADGPLYAFFDDMFINADGQQLRIRFDHSISTLKQNLSEARTETLGSKYPFVRRNGYINYRSMSISGLITVFDDYEDTFTSKEDLYGNDSTSLYEEYNSKNRINDYNDYILEREFREKVIEFLYDDTVKLVRTLTEGNRLVRLMDISLSPKSSLGRYIYTFSCTAYEIADCTLENYAYYGIYEAGVDNAEALNSSSSSSTEDKTDTNTEYVLGQITSLLTANTNYVDYIAALYDSFISFDSIQIQFYDEPQLIAESGGGLIYTTDMDAAIGTGYIVYVNEQAIMVSESGTYKLSDLTNETFTSFYVIEDCDADIDYVILASIDEEESGSSTSDNDSYTISYYYEDIISQLWGNYDYGEELYDVIEDKHYSTYGTVTSQLLSIDGISIEADKNTSIYIQTQDQSESEQQVITESCILTIQDDSMKIASIYLGGKYLEKATNSTQELVTSDRYYEDSGAYSSLAGIAYPKDNWVYTVDGQRYIWYNNAWETFSDNNEVEISLDVIINYSCRLMKGVKVSS